VFKATSHQSLSWEDDPSTKWVLLVLTLVLFQINEGKKPVEPINPAKPVFAVKLCPDKAAGGY
jgi:hypothetical protein